MVSKSRTAVTQVPKSLLQPTGDAPRLQVLFASRKYLDATPEQPSVPHPTWKTWLCGSIGVRERLRLVSRSGDSLSEALTYVAEHRAEKFLGMLQYPWEYEGNSVMRSNNLKEKLKNLEAKDLCSCEIESVKLRNTWFPLPALRATQLHYMDEWESFPFLALEQAAVGHLGAEWEFLFRYLDVGVNSDLPFYLDIIAYLKINNPSYFPLSRAEKVLELYAMIEIMIWISEEKEKAASTT